MNFPCRLAKANRSSHSERGGGALYWERQVARCTEAIALCDRKATPEEIAEAWAVIDRPQNDPQQESLFNA